MALTRRALKAMGIDEEKIDEIISMHAETVDGLKSEMAGLRSDTAALPGLRKQLEQAQADLQATQKDGWQDKYNTVKKEFDGYKQEQEAKAARSAKEAAYRALLKEAGISEKRMDTVVRAAAADGVLDGLELDEKSAIKDAGRLTEEVKTEWADFIVQTSRQGAAVPAPPAGGGTMTRAEIAQMKDPAKRRACIAQNMALFEKGE